MCAYCPVQFSGPMILVEFYICSWDSPRMEVHGLWCNVTSCYPQSPSSVSPAGGGAGALCGRAGGLPRAGGGSPKGTAGAGDTAC